MPLRRPLPMENVFTPTSGTRVSTVTRWMANRYGRRNGPPTRRAMAGAWPPRRCCTRGGFTSSMTMKRSHFWWLWTPRPARRLGALIAMAKKAIGPRHTSGRINCAPRSLRRARAGTAPMILKASCFMSLAATPPSRLPHRTQSLACCM